MYGSLSEDSLEELMHILQEDQWWDEEFGAWPVRDDVQSCVQLDWKDVLWALREGTLLITQHPP